MKKLLLILLFVNPLFAKDIITIQTPLSFNDALDKLNSLILDDDYQITIVQRCDYGLKQSGYQSDKYRVVYFGRYEDVKQISDSHVGLSVFLPLKILLVSKGDKTVLSTMNPDLFLETVQDKNLKKVVQRMSTDIKQIMKMM